MSNDKNYTTSTTVKASSTTQTKHHPHYSRHALMNLSHRLLRTISRLKALRNVFIPSSEKAHRMSARTATCQTPPGTDPTAACLATAISSTTCRRHPEEPYGSSRPYPHIPLSLPQHRLRLHVPFHLPPRSVADVLRPPLRISRSP